jgi:hypothetical protein
MTTRMQASIGRRTMLAGAAAVAGAAALRVLPAFGQGNKRIVLSTWAATTRSC